ncbi:hypothetical protein [Spirosoma humi]
MKVNLTFLVSIAFLFSRCSPNEGLSPKIDYDQASIELMQEIQPKIVGQWTLRQVNIKYQDFNYSQKQLKITKDTAFVDFATLSIIPTNEPRSSPRDLRTGEYDGTIQFGTKAYPIQFDLRSNAEWIYSKKGPQAFFSFSYKFPVGTRVTESEERFLEDIGLMNDTFSLEFSTDPKKMIWRGLNRGVSRIEMTKK